MSMKLIKPIYGPEDVRTLLALKDSLHNQRKKLRALEEAVAVHESRLVDYVEGNGVIPGFHLDVRIQERRCPSYRDALLKIGGSELLARIISDTPPTKSKKLIITESADE